MNQFIEVPATKRSKQGRKLVYGIGINDAEYNVGLYINRKKVSHCPYYLVWKSMLQRCYSKLYQSKKPTYIGCYTCKEWQTFSNFKRWMEEQDWEGKRLDKDIINPDNKEYCKESCCFVTQEINTLLVKADASRGEYPLGVCFDKKTNTFTAYCCLNGKGGRIGYYKTVNEANIAYCKFKNKVIIDVANKVSDVRVKKGLLLHAKIYLNNSHK